MSIVFHERLPLNILATVFAQSKKPVLPILDEVKSDAGNDRKVLDLFFEESHDKKHRHDLH